MKKGFLLLTACLFIALNIQAQTTPVTGITLSADTLKKQVGDANETLTVTIEPTDATDKTVTWSTDDVNVATVADGVVTFVGLGETYIIAKTNDGSDLKDTCVVQVSAPASVPVTSISIDKDTLKKQIGDANETLNVTITPSNATNKTVAWSSSAPTVATVDNNGAVSFKSVGNAYIIAATTDGSDLKDTCVVQVAAAATTPVTSIVIKEDTLKKTIGSATVTLTVTIEPTGATDKTLSWTTSDAKVATVDKNGAVSFVGLGETYIIAKTNDGSNLKDTCVVQVIPVAVTGITLNKDSISLIEGDTLSLRATITPNDATNKIITWSSQSPTIASAVAGGLVTAVKAGKTKIIATTSDGQYADTCIVLVMKKVLFVEADTVKTQNAIIELSLNLPDTVKSFTGTFTVKFPTGITLNENTTKLASGFSETSSLDITAKSSTIWEITIKNKDLRSLLRSSSNKKIMDIGYKVNNNAGNGEYIIKFTDLEVLLDNNEKMEQESMDVKVRVDIKTSTDIIEGESVQVYRANNQLYISSMKSEMIHIYSLSGKLVYSSDKPEGLVAFNLNTQEQILIVKGSSGWVKKVSK